MIVPDKLWLLHIGKKCLPNETSNELDVFKLGKYDQFDKDYNSHFAPQLA